MKSLIEKLMKSLIEKLFQRLPSLYIDHISVCFTLRERGDRARKLWTRNGMPTAYAARLSEYWKKRAAEDPALARRLIGLYLEHYSKSGDPSQSINCAAHPEALDLEGLARSPGPYVAKAIRRTLVEITGEADDSPRVAPPPLSTQIASATGSVTRWVSNGLKMASNDELERRKAICAGCEFWDREALQGTGRCLQCGCSTWAKLRMASESCPIGKWGQV